ncbi:hypothetical protein HDU76_003836 [Blyttiomyces sp. JEL0837]|nr:hypothetical protein HDU76_003836 [Blyttiomyces sp. JEL0837]
MDIVIPKGVHNDPFTEEKEESFADPSTTGSHCLRELKTTFKYGANKEEGNADSRRDYNLKQESPTRYIQQMPFRRSETFSTREGIKCLFIADRRKSAFWGQLYGQVIPGRYRAFLVGQCFAKDDSERNNPEKLLDVYMLCTTVGQTERAGRTVWQKAGIFTMKTKRAEWFAKDMDKDHVVGISEARS